MGGRGASSSMVGGFPNSIIKETVYHGTNNPNIKEFSTKGRESNGAIFFANDPDYAEEEAYTKQQNYGGEQTMYEAKIDIRNPLVVTLKGNEFADDRVERKYIKQAKENGNDAVIFNSDFGDPILEQTFYAVFSPKQVKINKKTKL